MSWRKFKTDSGGFKGFKGFKPPEQPPLKPLKHLKPADGILEKADPGDLFALIGETLAEINATKPDWTGWRRSLTQEQRDRLRDLEAEIDLAALDGDRRRLERALENYRTEIN